MEWSRWTGLVAAFMGAAIGAGTAGCTHTCYDIYTCPEEEPICPGDPAEANGGEVPAECGIWVSASQGDDANMGTPEAPVATLNKALALATAGPSRVYACAETFEESLVWPAGVSFHGGYLCEGLDWEYAGAPAWTKVAPLPDQIPLTLIGSSHPGPSMLTDVWFLSANAKKPGGSSIAVLADADADAEIRRSKLQSGNGADGGDGGGGDHFGNPAKDGLHGLNGASACTGEIGEGGELVALSCDGGEDVSFGGKGGHGGEMSANAGDDGEVAPAANPQGFGLGGKGEDVSAGLFCTPGIGGAAGKDGDPGLGGSWPPRLTLAGYVGVWGEDGKRGRAGQGGGGGGASAGSAACGAGLPGGAGGGSGGTGGCGGKGGQGGQPGGASIGLAALTSRLILVDTKIIAGNGGRGGHGGVPQQGGQGGLPGVGGAGSLAGPNPGCVGGGGGYGGDGGHAGGGLGGPSIAVAYVGAVAPSVELPQIEHGLAGPGGAGSDPDLFIARGQNGKGSLLEPLLP